MDYFWLKKRTFLGTKTTNYVFIAGLLVIYSAHYNFDCEYVDYDNTISFGLNNLYINYPDVELNGGVLINLSPISLENTEINTNYVFENEIDLTGFDSIRLKPLLYSDYKYDFEASIQEIRPFYFALNRIFIEDNYDFDVNAELSENEAIDIDGLLITYSYPKYMEISGLELSDSEEFSLNSVYLDENIDLSANVDLTTRFYFGLNDIKYNSNISSYVGTIENRPTSNFSIGSNTIKDKYVFNANVELEANNMYYIGIIDVDYYYPQYIAIFDLDSSTINSFSVDTFYLNSKMDIFSNIGEFTTIRFNVSPIYLEEKIYVHIEDVSFSDVLSFRVGKAHTNVENEISVAIDLDSVRLPLNNLKVTYLSNIISYVNIILGESSMFSLSMLEIRNKINFYQNLESIEPVNLSFDMLNYNKNYSATIGTIEFAKIRKFYNLLGLKFSDLNGLEFKDLMFTN